MPAPARNIQRKNDGLRDIFTSLLLNDIFFRGGNTIERHIVGDTQMLLRFYLMRYDIFGRRIRHHKLPAHAQTPYRTDKNDSMLYMHARLRFYMLNEEEVHHIDII